MKINPSLPKRLFAVLVCAVIFTVLIAGTALAETEYCPDCGQELYIVDSEDADCDCDGYILYECSNCDYSIEVTLPALGHDYYLSSQGEATCAESAWREYTCSRCGGWYSEEEGEPLGHDYEATAHEDATCTQTGWTEYTCTRCGDEYVGSETAALGHAYRSVTTAPVSIRTISRSSPRNTIAVRTPPTNPAMALVCTSARCT